MKLKPWHLFAATGVALLLLVFGLNAEQGQQHPGPLVPYTLVVLAILFVSGIVLAIGRRSKKLEPVGKPRTRGR
jgi:hypothetical protein